MGQGGVWQPRSFLARSLGAEMTGFLHTAIEEHAPGTAVRREAGHLHPPTVSSHSRFSRRLQRTHCSGRSSTCRVPGTVLRVGEMAVKPVFMKLPG